MKLAALLLFALTASAQSAVSFRVSQAMFIGAATVDGLSSRGFVERNPVLGAGPFGRRQSITLGAITAGAVLGGELIVRKWPKSRGVVRWANWIGAGLHLGAAGHNWGNR